MRQVSSVLATAAIAFTVGPAAAEVSAPAGTAPASPVPAQSAPMVDAVNGFGLADCRQMRL